MSTSEIIFEEKQLIIKAGCDICTPCFHSLAERIELNIEGRGNVGAEILCEVYSYDDAGIENLVHSEHVVLAECTIFRIGYYFDPVSLGVYQNAVKFRIRLCVVSEDEEIFLERFFVEEKTDLVQEEEGKMQSFRNVTASAIPKKVLFVGNSILLGMFYDYGMCASSAEKDYAYYVQQKIQKYNSECVFYKLYGSGFEHAESLEAFEAWFSHDKNAYTGRPARESFTEDLDLILIQLTDNVNTAEKIANFNQTADILLERIKEQSPHARIIWIHGWFNKLNTYEKLLRLCGRWQIERVDISNLHRKENEAYSGQLCLHPEYGEQKVRDTWITHPGDAGMKAIAGRILETLGL